MTKPHHFKRVKVFVEGGSLGEGKNQSANIAFRRAFAKIAEDLKISNSPQFVPCGGRTQTFDRAWDEFINRSEDELILLLVDGEDPSKYEPERCWKHLRAREGIKWNALEERHAPYIFMMATCMETWLVADQDSLGKFFGNCLNQKAFKAWPDLESVPRSTLFDTLRAATTECESRQYKKGEISFQALQAVDPKTIAKSCPHARRFFAELPRLCSKPA